MMAGVSTTWALWIILIPFALALLVFLFPRCAPHGAMAAAFGIGACSVAAVLEVLQNGPGSVRVPLGALRKGTGCPMAFGSEVENVPDGVDPSSVHGGGKSVPPCAGGPASVDLEAEGVRLITPWASCRVSPHTPFCHGPSNAM